ncbi:MAG TPA: penicillin-insensitive murein endopeptidase [Kofleriaceae bacterium]
MRALVLALGVLALTAAPAAAHAKRRTAKHARIQERPRARDEKPERVVRPKATGQSVGAPWRGRLQHPVEFPAGDGYVIRRPWRSFGTQETVDLVGRVVRETLDELPDVHVLAIGDISAEHGGAISEHHSHQSGRDADIGLFYNEKPRGYPENFVRATEDNLDCAATFTLLDNFVATKHVQMIFLDFEVQGILYRWALDHGISQAHLDRVFQYPHGRGSSDGIVRHWPNHDNHMHVRFNCQDQDNSCH